MKIESISVSRRATYEMNENNTEEFKCNITVTGQLGYEPKISIGLTQEQIEPIVAIISQLVAQNMQEAATAFHQEVQAALVGPVVEQEVDALEFIREGVHELDDPF